MELWVFKVRRSGVIASEMKEEWGDVLCYWTISKKKREGGSGGVGSGGLGSGGLGSGELGRIRERRERRIREWRIRERRIRER